MANVDKQNNDELLMMTNIQMVVIHGVPGCVWECVNTGNCDENNVYVM